MRNNNFVTMVLVAQIAAAGGISTQPAFAAMRSEYVVKNDKVGINAYVYGKRTILEFVEAPFSLVVKDKQGFSVSYERIGERYYRLARQLDKFTVTVGGEAVEFDVYKPEQIVAMPPAQPDIVSLAASQSPLPPPAPVASSTAVASVAQPIDTAPQRQATLAAAAPKAEVVPITLASASTASVPKPADIKAAETPVIASAQAVQEKTAVAEKPALVWEVEAADLSVYAAIKRWTRLTQRQEKKWQLSWEIPRDYPVTITGTYTGDFEVAVGELLKGYSKADYRPKACVYSNNVVRIVRFLGTGTECD